MSKVNKVIKVILYLTLIVCAIMSYVGYSYSQQIIEYVGYGATALNLLCIIIVEIVDTVKRKKANGETFGLMDFLQILYNCLPVLVGYAEGLDKVSGGAIKGKDKENAVIEQLKLICDQQQVKFYEEQARAIITPIIESDKIIQKIKDGTLTFADISQMLSDLKDINFGDKGNPSAEEEAKKEPEKVPETTGSNTENSSACDSILLADTLLQSNAELQRAVDGIKDDNQGQ